MDTARWQRLQELFDGAMQVPGEQRGQWLAEACPDDSELRSHAESLILHEAQASRFGDAISDAALVYSVLSEPAPGERLGPYRILRLLGRGGMGAVFQAERDDEQFRMTVAIKLVRPNLLTPEMLARFKTERQILASLDHPNIAHLLDGGTTANGTPYVVIEYIDGEPITDYSRRHDLSIRERIRLFRKVCSAVHYAHQSLIVHRDLKPGNILVTKDAEPKLLDFGIAKLLDAAASSQTQTVARLMTPDYASPEQVRGEPVTTATDVYALGVLLYELLTGQLPYKPATSDLYSIEQAICTAEPARPSATRRELRGDLENILMMALRKEAARRYSSAEQFSEDLRRFMDGYPVLARQDTWSYRTAKFVRRNKAGVVATAAVVLLIVAFAITMAVQANRIARERDAANLERQKSEQVAAFLADLFSRADPSRSKGAAITAREILDSGAQRVETELAGQPQVEATMMTQIGNVYQSLGLYDSARTILEKALAIRKRALGERNPDVAASLQNLATVLRDLGDYDKALTYAQESLAMRRQLLGNHSKDLIPSLNTVAILLEDKADYRGSEKLHREAVALLRSQEPDLPRLAASLNNLAGVLGREGRDAEALPLYKEALELRRKTLGNEHPATMQTLNNLGVYYIDHRDYASAEKAMREVLSVRLKLLGPDHPDVAKAMTNLSVALTREMQFDESITLLNRALDIFRRRLGEKHVNVAYVLDALAEVYYRKHNYETADPIYRRSWQMFRSQFGDQHPEVALSSYNLAGNLEAWGKYDAAEQFVRKAERIYRDSIGADSQHRLRALVRLADVLRDKGDFAAAEATYREALDAGRKTWKPESTDRAAGLAGLGEVLAAHGQAQQAEGLLREAVAIRRKILPRDDVAVAHVESALGGCLTLLSRCKEAAALLANALPLIRAADGIAGRETRLSEERLRKLASCGSRP